MIALDMPGLRTVSELNQREHWSARHKRASMQKAATRVKLRGKACPKDFSRATVTMTRVAPHRLDDGDNLQSSMKHVRDAIAYHYFGVDDRDPRITWLVLQRKDPKPRTYGVEVLIEVDAIGGGG